MAGSTRVRRTSGFQSFGNRAGRAHERRDQVLTAMLRQPGEGGRNADRGDHFSVWRGDRGAKTDPVKCAFLIVGRVAEADDSLKLLFQLDLIDDGVLRNANDPIAPQQSLPAVLAYTHLRAHETRHDLVCRLL